MKGFLPVAARSLVSVSILCVVVSRVSLEEIRVAAESARPVFLLAALVISMLSILLVALRWQLVARTLGLVISVKLAVRALFVGVFGGQVLPSALGTDAVRGWLIARHTAAVPQVLASLLSDRLYALFGACLIMTFSSLITGITAPYPVQVAAIAALVSGSALAAFLAWSCGMFKLPAWTRAPARLKGLSALDGARMRPAPIVLALGLALAVQVAAVLVFVLTAEAYAVDATLGLWFSIVPLSIIASAVPISINGWGVREATIVALAGTAGVPAGQAMLVSVTVGLLNIFASLPGALLIPVGRNS